MKVRLISELYIKENSPITFNVQMKELYTHIDSTQEIYLQQTLGTEFFKHILFEFNQQTLNQNEIDLVKYYIQPAVLFRMLYLALPFLHYNIRQKGVMVNTDDAANAADLSQFKFIYNEVKTRAENLEHTLKDYLCANSSLFPNFRNPNDLIKSNLNKNSDFGLLFY